MVAQVVAAHLTVVEEYNTMYVRSYGTAQIQRCTRSRYFSRLALASRSTCVECSSLLPKSSSTLCLQLKLL